MCHTADYAARATDLGATYDGVEERSIHTKVMIHRIHTGGRKGSASLEALHPFNIDGAFFEGLFPNDLRDCTVCHEGKSYLVESVPPDASPTVANETGTILHQGTSSHTACERTPPIQAACLGCHATGATFAHIAEKTVGGVETCATCHEKGPVSVEVAHGLAPPSGGVSTAFSSIEAQILVPRCASAACHSGSPPVAFPSLEAGAAWQAMVGVPSGQASGMNMVEPGAPERSYLMFKLRNDAAAAGGSVATPMPPAGDTLLDPADIAAIEAWILNGAPND
jgi:hypothetical protein